MTCRIEDLTIEPAPRAVRRVGILTHPRMLVSEQLAQDLAGRFAAMGVTAEVAPRVSPDWLKDVDCLIVLGGDGSVVLSARAVAGTGVPILGINLGQLGFLAELQPGDPVLDGRLEALARGEYRIERRAMLRAVLTPAQGEASTFDALNDVVMARGARVRVIGVTVFVDGQRFTTYRADGIIVATPTGSTAYSLSVGGPIVAPMMDTLTVVPVAPHLVPTRALVVPGGSTVRLQMSNDYEGVLAVDGQLDQPVSGGDVVNVTTSPKCVGFVRFGPPADFYGTLFRRLRWASHNP